MNQFKGYQKLGMRTFWVFVLENSGPAFIIIIAWCVVGFLKANAVPSLSLLIPQSSNASEAITRLLDVALVGGVAFIILAFLFAFFLATIYYWTYHFSLDEDGLHIKQGILNKSELSVPYRQIQNVNVDQTLLYQILGVSRVAVQTAGHDGKKDDEEDDSEVVIPIISKPRAEALREELLRLASVQKIVNVSETQEPNY